MIPFSWMSYQARINAQSHSTYFADGFGMRVPVAGTVSRGHIPYIYKDSLAQPAAPLTNPLVPSTRILALGQKKFNTFCSPCHGYFGEGDGRLPGQFPKPPSLHTAKLRAWADGNIYHVVMNGQNVMSSYAAQLSGDEAWAIVNYVRVLQKAKNANAEEVNQFRKEVSADVTK
jgi:mono/diheme cytochrome c family protein